MAPDPFRECLTHPKVAAARECTTCGAAWCSPCSTVSLPQGEFAVCPQCKGRGRLTTIAPQVRATEFAREAHSAWRYPLAGQGKVILGAAFVMQVVMALLILYSGTFLAIFFNFFISFGFAYVWRFLLDIIVATTQGKDELPEWPDFVSLIDDALVPLGRLGVACVLCALPSGLVWTLFPHAEGAAILVLLLGLATLPMQVFVLALGGRVTDLNPLIILPAILRAGPTYFTLVVLLVLTLSTRSVISFLFSAPLLGITLGAAASVYLLAVQMRMIGLLYRARGHALGLV